MAQRHKERIFGLSVLLCALAPWCLRVSAVGSFDQSQPPQTFRSGTDLVEVDVRVFKDGTFVTDLRPEDFDVRENGEPQKVVSAVLVGAAPGAPQAPPAPQPPGAPQAPRAPLAPSVWLFVFDTPHLSPVGLQRTREAVVKFLDERWRQGDIGGVVFDGKMANNRLTSDRAELRAAVQAVKQPGDQRTRQLEMTREWPRFETEYEVIRVAVDADRETVAQVVQRACSDDPSQCNTADLAIREKAARLASDIERSTLNALNTVQALANGLARMPGPKTVVFLSEGFTTEKLESQLRQAVGDAGRAGAHFYTIDARGLNKGKQATLVEQPYASAPGAPTVQFDSQEDATNSLAVDTGGLAIRNENNFGRALDEIQRDAATYYVIGYSPTNRNFDGKYRTIEVKVNRPGVKVRTRRGYLALAPAKMLNPQAPRGPAAPKPPQAVEAGAEGARPAESAEHAEVAPGAALTLNPTPAFSAPSAPVAPSAAPLARLAPTGPSASDSEAARSGWSAYQRGDLETAAQDLTKAAADPAAHPWVFYALGMSQYALQRYRAAADAWERVRREAAEFEPVYFSLADAYGMQHDESQAIRILREAEKRWPNDPEVANAIGVFDVRRGALDAAIESFQRAVVVAPKDPLGYFNLARTLQMRMAKFQRYDPQTQKWVGGNEDRRRARENFQKYLELGGPYEQQVREALASLAWK
jgi:VWFA-related protein